ncbi:hypothetical protein [Stieleria neptunia]|nr:hypothetical protein [Stieleria neptunia]
MSLFDGVSSDQIHSVAKEEGAVVIVVRFVTPPLLGMAAKLRVPDRPLH